MAGSQVQLSTFLKWNIDHSIIGYQTKQFEGKEMVVQVHCKMCARHVEKLRADSQIKGQALKEIEKYVSGTNYVTKYTVMRHMSSNAHKISLEMERLAGNGKPTSQLGHSGGASKESQPSTSQPRIDGAMHSAATDAYQKLIKTAYLLAVDGLPLTSFRTLVKVQKLNGVRLISGRESGTKAREFVHEIANAIRDKLAVLITSSNAMSVLTDGSQARKTGREKELILVRLVRGGVPVYYCVSLQDVDDFGDANAAHLKECIDDCFLNKLGITKDKYTTVLVSSTSDGASVNTGIYNGLLTRMARDDRPWLIPLHCVSHRLELAIKDSLLKHKEFSEVKEFMQTIYYLFKQSGKVKRHFHKMGDILDTQVYTMPKVHGTRFVNHVRRGLDHLLKNWAVLVTVMENSLETTDMRKIHAKIRGVMKKLKNYKFLSTRGLMKNILDNISKFSLLLEKSEIQAPEIIPAVEKTKSRNQDVLAESEYLEDCYGMELKPEEKEVYCRAVRKGHMRRKKGKREYTTLICKGMTNIDNAIVLRNWGRQSYQRLITV